MTPETAEKHALKDYLDLLGFFHFPLTAGIGSYRGAPDRIGIKNGRVYAFEVKRPGGKLTEHEQVFAANWVANGGFYLYGTFDEIERQLIEADNKRK